MTSRHKTQSLLEKIVKLRIRWSSTEDGVGVDKAVLPT